MQSNEKNTNKFGLPGIALAAASSVFTVVIIMSILSLLIINDNPISAGLFRFLSERMPATERMAGDNSAMLGKYNDESSTVSSVEKADPAVVSIVITKDVPIMERYYQEYDPFGDSFFDDFFGGFNMRIPQQRQKGTEKKEIGGGSGFFVSPDGYIVTNRHVVDDAEAEYTVMTNDGKKYPAKVLAKDSMIDVAILKVEGKDFKYLSFADSDKLKSGQTVIAIGNALAEFRNSVSEGVISGLSRSITAGDAFGKSEQLEGVIQTDAGINPGNSGGPLLNSSGEVIGVNVAMQRGAENIAFALPGNMIKRIFEEVKQNGEISRPYLGVRYVMVNEELKKKNNLKYDYGVLVLRGETQSDLAVIPGSPADKAGIEENDIILEIDGVKIDKEKSLASLIRQKSAGQEIKLKIVKKGEEKELRVKLEKAPKE